MKIKISKEDMIDILDGDSEEGSIISDKIIDTARWSELHDIVFSYKGKHYSAGYSCGATEMQEEGPWEYEKEVDCTEVHQVEKLVKVWEAVNV